MKGTLQGRVAVVTGSSKGLGRAIAVALAAEGAKVALVARGRAQLEVVAEEVRGHGGEAHVFPTDITSEEQVRQLEHDVIAECGPVHILVNNAGINIRRKIADFTLQEWNSVMTTNVTAVFLMCRSFVPQMQKLGYGRIVNMASTMAWVSLPQRAAYSASKTAVLGITRALALELAHDGITVNSISPGPFATDMNQALLESPELSAQFTASVPLGRWGKLEEVGQLAVYLCSEAAGFVTGTDILIDGGWTAR